MRLEGVLAVSRRLPVRRRRDGYPTCRSPPRSRKRREGRWARGGLGEEYVLLVCFGGEDRAWVGGRPGDFDAGDGPESRGLVVDSMR